jgi:hypothetical protein
MTFIINHNELNYTACFTEILKVEVYGEPAKYEMFCNIEGAKNGDHKEILASISQVFTARVANVTFAAFGKVDAWETKPKEIHSLNIKVSSPEKASLVALKALVGADVESSDDE